MKQINASVINVANPKAVNPNQQIKQALSALVLFFILVPFAWSATYYVDTNGNDANSGLSLSAPFRTIQKAMNTATAAGSTVYVRGGTYREDVEVGIGGGTAGNMVHLLAYGTEVPVIKGSEVVTGWTQYSGSIWKKSGWPY